MDSALLEACRDQFEHAADWWVEQLTGMPGRDAGFSERDDPSGIASAIARMEAVTAPPADELSLQKFRAELLATILREAAKHICICLATDYGPGTRLGDAAKIAGVSSRRFPIKTIMWIRAGETRVRAGYSAADATIWPQPFADAFQKAFEQECGDPQCAIEFRMLDAGSLNISARDIYECAEIQKPSSCTAGPTSVQYAVGFAIELAQAWKLREKIQCRAANNGLGCYRGKMNDATGSACPVCNGKGYKTRDQR